MAIRDDDFGLWAIHFDPQRPRKELFTSADEALIAVTSMLAPTQIPWPHALRPTPAPPAKKPTDAMPLSTHDVLIVTWTSGEARTLANLMTGGNYDNWFEYRHNVNAFIPKVTGARAPFNDSGASEARYHHSLGLYYPLKVGDASVLAFKSGLHMAYDGSAMPMVDLWKQLIAEVQPKLVITTGTGGGIGADIKLGDVVIGAHARFDLTGVLKGKPFKSDGYACSPIDEARVKALVTDALLKPNGDLLDVARIPRMVYPSAPKADIVSTDTFAFDDSTDHFKLQALGKCCDMGDATLGLAISQLGANAPKWIAIRNASDPQIVTVGGDLAAAKKQAEKIYAKYQAITTAGSVVASWAVAVAALGL